MRLTIIDINHDTENCEISVLEQGIGTKPTLIIEGAFIGINSEVTIGKHSVIGNNSAVTKGVCDYVVVVGSPARIIRRMKWFMKNFTTLFLECEKNVLNKDVGQIPYRLSKYYIGTIASMELDSDDVISDITPGLKVYNIRKIVNGTVSGIYFLLKNSKKIDILNMYHCRKRVYIFAKLYKLLNKCGLVYIKLDAGNTTLEKIERDKIYRRLFYKLTKISDVVSSESKTILKSLERYSSKKIDLIPNGVPYVCASMPVKKNVFFTAGRIGAPEKNNEIILEAFSKVSDKCDWELHFVGKIEEAFAIYIENFFDKHPKLRDRVVFYGEITDRKELYKIYADNKVFLLPSKFENFSLACVEALANGCYLILSDQVSPKLDFTDDWKYGMEVKVNDVDDLADKMLKVSQMNIDEKLISEIISYARENFLWENICDRLHDVLIEKEI